MSQIDIDLKKAQSMVEEFANGMGRPVTGHESLALTAAMYLKQRDDLLAACETVWEELKNRLASITAHVGFPFKADSPCTVYFLDRIVQCNTVIEGIAKCDELMAEEFPAVYAAIAAARGGGEMTPATDVNGEAREWCIKTTYPDRSFEYGSNLSRSIADEWVRVQNRAWGWLGIIHQVVHISERDGEK